MRGLRSLRASGLRSLRASAALAAHDAVGLRAVVKHQESLLDARVSTIASLKSTVETLTRTADESAAATARLTAEVSRLKAAAPAVSLMDAIAADRRAQDARDFLHERAMVHADVLHELDVALRRTSAHGLLAACLEDAKNFCWHSGFSRNHAGYVPFLQGCKGFHALLRVTATDNFQNADRVVAAAGALVTTVGEHARAREEDEDGRSIPLDLFNIDDDDNATFLAFAALVHFTGRNVRRYLTSCEDVPTLRLRYIHRCSRMGEDLTEATALAAPLFRYSTMR